MGCRGADFAVVIRLGGHMRTRLAWMLAGVCLSVALAALVAAAPGEKSKAAWEYKFVTARRRSPADPDANFSNGPNALRGRRVGQSGFRRPRGSAGTDHPVHPVLQARQIDRGHAE